MLSGPVCPQISPKWKIISAKLPEICQSCAKLALYGKNCAVARKRKSCAPQHRDFMVGLPIAGCEQAACKHSIQDMDTPRRKRKHSEKN